MKIIDKDGFYWTENKTMRGGYWSKFESLSDDERDFHTLKAISLFLSMWLAGIKVRIIQGLRI